MKPQRIRLSRKKGFDLQAASIELNGLPAVNVARPTRWGNPFSVKEYGRYGAVDRFKVFMTLRPAVRGKLLSLDELKGKNLACWCAENEMCHADVLLKLANEDQLT